MRQSHRFINSLGTICLLMLLGISTLLGQSDSTYISGFVRDPSGGVMPGVTVTVRSEGREFERSAVSNEQGYYTITNLPPGSYTITAELTGFKKYQITGKKIDPNIAATLDIAMQIGELTETVSVVANSSGVQSESAAVGKLVEGKQIEMLQLNGRNPLFLALLKPGVNAGGAISQFSFGLTTGGININGARTQDNLITYDGAVAVRTRSNGISIGTADVDSVQEVQIMTANYSAEFGRSSGGQIRMVTKSGTRDFHGGVYEYIRNSALDANTWTRNKTNTAGDKPCTDDKWYAEQHCRPGPYRYNQFGYNASGPITFPGFNQDRSKLFWLWGQEWLRYRRADSVNITVPSLAMRKGDFSELLSASNRFTSRVTPITDPQTGQPFPNNIIPTTRLSPNGIGLLKAFPEPIAGYIGSGSNNYFQEGPNKTDQRKDTLSIDWYPNEKHAIRWRAQLFHYIDYSWQRGSTDRVPGGLKRPNQTTSLSWTWSVSPTLVNEFLATASRDQVFIYVDYENGKYHRGDFGINYPYVYQDGTKEIADRIPTIVIPGFVTVDGGPYPSSSTGPIYVFTDNMTKIWGNHTFKAGFSFERSGQNDYDQINVSGVPGGTNNQNGRFEFTNGRTGGTGLAVSNAALGLFDAYAEIGKRSYTPYRGHMYEWYVQDGWKITPKLRLELGVRHTINQPYWSLWRNMVVFDPGSYNAAIAVTQDPKTGYILTGDLKSRYNGLVFPGNGWPEAAKGRVPMATSGEYDFMFRGMDKNYSKTHLKDFQPRAGIAYSINSKSVIRGGIGRFFTRLGVSDSVFLGGNPPLQPMVSLSLGSVDNPAGSSGKAFPLPITTQDPIFKNPESWVWNVSYEQQLPWNTVVEIAYVGRHGLHGQRERDYNSLKAGTLQANPGINQDYLRPYKGFSYIRMTGNDAESKYKGLQLSANRRFTGGFAFGAAYTLSKLDDNGSAQRDVVPNSYDVSALWGPATYDRRHVLVINAIWELPFFKGNQGLMGKIIGGWTASFTSQFQTGTPFTIATSDDVAGVGTTNGPQIWVVNGDPKLSNKDKKFSESNSDGFYWFKVKTDSGGAMFTKAATGTFNTQRVRDLLYNPGFQSHNLGVVKDFMITESQKITFRFEAYNWPNHPNWGGAGTTPTSGSFGKVQGKSSERGLQLALKYSF